MIEPVTGPLVLQPQYWTLVFSSEASTRWASWLALGRYKHVRAYAYVPFLHVWVFYDPHLRGTDIVVTADGQPAQAMIQLWAVKADLIKMQVRARPRRPAVFGFCVPAIRRLIGIPGGALRPDALWQDCLRNGGVPFEAVDGSPQIRPAAA